MLSLLNLIVGCFEYKKKIESLSFLHTYNLNTSMSDCLF